MNRPSRPSIRFITNFQSAVSSSSTTTLCAPGRVSSAGLGRRLAQQLDAAAGRFGPIGVAGVYGVGEPVESPNGMPEIAADRSGGREAPAPPVFAVKRFGRVIHRGLAVVRRPAASNKANRSLHEGPAAAAMRPAIVDRQGPTVEEARDAPSSVSILSLNSPLASCIFRPRREECGRDGSIHVSRTSTTSRLKSLRSAGLARVLCRVEWFGPSEYSSGWFKHLVEKRILSAKGSYALIASALQSRAEAVISPHDAASCGASRSMRTFGRLRSLHSWRHEAGPKLRS